ncbi:CRISPR-associated endonuclease Cas2 [Lampropedia puyangensis]|uniref:CRISPR-associated endoribonuclease Cas2 n=1 Tax=Lampropedia puyangensis TaxID=1330072 RepID=A0A4S8FB77_9BURK|nr:CRISPR-associated endonuclease Cas2 [Lampropedia puyangensis]THU04479.1 CRISPR-associated endonuclease Cas2 [Lampropedia puyangensis]
MLILVSYDVSTTSEGGQRRLRRIARECQNYGQRVQYSVFEIEVNTAQWVALKDKLCSLIDPDLDSLRFYYMGQNWKHKVEHIGAKPSVDLNGPLVF